MIVFQSRIGLEKIMKLKSLVLIFLFFSSCYLQDAGRDTDSTGSDYAMTSYLVKRGEEHFLPTKTPVLLPAPALALTPEVQKQLNHFSRRDPRFIIESFGRREGYEPYVSQIFRDEGMPPVLINLALVESGFKSRAKSHAGAKGLWQFMKGTGKQYGLKISYFEDQRTDPVLATIAATRLLRDLYNMFDDWYLALAAYNAGPGKVRRAIKSSGVKDFWALSRMGYFRRETREFVPKFIAVSIIEKFPDKYGFDPVQILASRNRREYS